MVSRKHRGLCRLIISLFRSGLLFPCFHLDGPSLDILAALSGWSLRWRAPTGKCWGWQGLPHITEEFNLVPGQSWSLAESESCFKDAARSVQLLAMDLHQGGPRTFPWNRTEGSGAVHPVEMGAELPTGVCGQDSARGLAGQAPSPVMFRQLSPWVARTASTPSPPSCPSPMPEAVARLHVGLLQTLRGTRLHLSQPFQELFTCFR